MLGAHNSFKDFQFQMFFIPVFALSVASVTVSSVM